MNALPYVDPRYLHQEKLEELFDKNQLFPRIRKTFREAEDGTFLRYLKEQDIPEKFGIDLLAQMAVRKRAQLEALVGILRHHFLQEDQPTQACADMLERAARADLVDYSDRDRQFIVIYTIAPELQAEIDRFQYPLPMVVPPLPLQSNLDSGYLTARSSVLLRNNHHNEDVCLDHLNRVNSIKLTINLSTARTIQNRWRNLDKRKPGESWEKFQQRKRAFEKYDSVAKDVISLLVQEGNEIYLTHRYDKRGRIYCMGYHVNYQGNDWNKAMIEFADQEPVKD